MNGNGIYSGTACIIKTNKLKKDKNMQAFEIDQNQWGVCGFVAAIQAKLYNKHGAQVANTSYDNVFPEVQAFCTKNIALEKELLDFSKVFGDEFKYKKLSNVLNIMQPDKRMDNEVGLAMTGKAVALLCRDLGMANADFHGTTVATSHIDWNKPNPFPYKNTIYGLGRKDRKGNFRAGLLHWVYVDPTGVVMTYGNYGQNAVNMLNTLYDKITHYIPL